MKKTNWGAANGSATPAVMAPLGDSDVAAAGTLSKAGIDQGALNGKVPTVKAVCASAQNGDAPHLSCRRDDDVQVDGESIAMSAAPVAV